MMLDGNRDLLWDDYRLLAAKLGINSEDIVWPGRQSNVTASILEVFNTQKDPSIGHFKKLLERMGRNDVVAVIEDWLLYEWNERKNSSSVS